MLFFVLEGFFSFPHRHERTHEMEEANVELTKELLEKIDSWVDSHMDRLVEDTCQLIRIRSVSDKTTEVKPFGQGCKDVLAKYI